ncbi:MAG: tetratricopeptide repeat protein [Lachnospiraceae bacterium]|nr:tetratricopeptide repeat protein [Lachnospiraceae bacterium]
MSEEIERGDTELLGVDKTTEEVKIEIEQAVIKKKKSKMPFVILGTILLIGIAVFIAIMVASAKPERKVAKELELARQYLDEMNYEMAIASYTKVIEIDPKNVEAYLGLADVYIATGDYDEALNVLNEALEKIEDENAIETIKKKIEEIKTYIKQYDVSEGNICDETEQEIAISQPTINEEAFWPMYYDLLDCAYYDGVMVDEKFSIDDAVAGYNLTYASDDGNSRTYNYSTDTILQPGIFYMDSSIQYSSSQDMNQQLLVICEHMNENTIYGIVALEIYDAPAYEFVEYEEFIWPGMELSKHGHGFYDVMEKYGCSDIYDILNLWGISKDESFSYVVYKEDGTAIDIWVDCVVEERADSDIKIAIFGDRRMDIFDYRNAGVSGTMFNSYWDK